MSINGFYEHLHEGSVKAGLRSVAAHLALGAMLLLAGQALQGRLASAQEPKFEGKLTVGFGRVKSENLGTKGLDGIGEATLNLSAKKERISAQVEVVLGDSSTQFDTVEHEVVWSPVESFSITISGSSFTPPATDGNISIVNVSSGPVGDEEVNLDFSGVGLLNIVYAIGPMKIGMALLDNCVPECGYAVDSSTAVSLNPDVDRMTLLLHARAKLTSIAYNAYLSRSSGTYLASSQNGNGLGGGAGLVYSSGAFRAALDVSTAIVECSVNAGNTSCSKDNEDDKFGIAVNLGRFGTHYYFSKNQTETIETETVNVDLVYLFEVGDAVLGPEYRQTVISPSNARSATDTFLLFGVAVKF